MPDAPEPTPAEQLADLLDGRLTGDDVPPELAELAELATAVREHVTLVPPTPAFRAALREQLVQTPAAPTGPAGAGGGAAPNGGTSAGTAATGTAATASGASGGLAGIVAGVAAAALLATGTVTVADRAGPGDLLAGLDRGVESLQLLLADDARDTELLVSFASERVLEAVDVADVAVVEELLAEADALVSDAIALAVAQGRSVDEVVAPYVGALLTLASRSDVPAVQAAVVQRLDELGVDASTGSPSGVAPTADESTSVDDDAGSEAPSQQDGDDGSAPSDDVTEPLDDVTEPLDDATEPLDDVTEPLDDVTEPLDDATEPLDDATEPLDDATEPLDDVTEPLDDATEQLVP